MEELVHHPWPGNVRELQHVVQRAVILSHGGSLELPPIETPVKTARTPAWHVGTLDDPVGDRIVKVLRETNGIVAGPRGAAVRLGLKRTTLPSRMKKLGITPADVVPAPLRLAIAEPARAVALSSASHASHARLFLGVPLAMRAVRFQA
jgi:transcriptional regulator with GAF, ATPase, and Fis domain